MPKEQLTKAQSQDAVNRQAAQILLDGGAQGLAAEWARKVLTPK